MQNHTFNIYLITFYPEFNIIVQCESNMVLVLSLNHCPHKERQLRVLILTPNISGKYKWFRPVCPDYDFIWSLQTEKCKVHWKRLRRHKWRMYTLEKCKTADGGTKLVCQSLLSLVACFGTCDVSSLFLTSVLCGKKQKTNWPRVITSLPTQDSYLSTRIQWFHLIQG